MSESKNDLDLAFEEFESEVGGNKVIRREMIESLRKALANPEMAPNPFDKAMALQAKMSVYKTLDDLIKSDEDITIKKIKMKLSRKNDETNGMVGATIIQLLKNIRVDGDASGNQQVDPNQAMDDIKKRTEEIAKSGDSKAAAAVKVSDGELEACEKVASDAARPDDEPTEDEK